MFVPQKMQMFDKIYYSDKNLLSFLYEKIKITPVFMANIFISGV